MDSPERAAPLTVPPEIRRWSWGAFTLNWIWGLGNGTFVALLALVPIVNVVVMVILGAKGNAWAWKNRKWDSLDQFQSVQRKWARWGAAVWLVMAVVAGVGAWRFVSVTRDDSNLASVAKTDDLPELHELDAELAGLAPDTDLVASLVLWQSLDGTRSGKMLDIRLDHSPLVAGAPEARRALAHDVAMAAIRRFTSRETIDRVDVRYVVSTSAPGAQMWKTTDPYTFMRPELVGDADGGE